ncbi:MAG: hypothetical protein ACTS8W_05305, partial [Arsenophonus sp. NC-PY1-MAG3]
CSSTLNNIAPPLKSQLSDPIMTISQLKDQLSQWYGTPYRYTRVSCVHHASGASWIDFEDARGKKDKSIQKSKRGEKILEAIKNKTSSTNRTHTSK